jgi:hypothetical protein
LTCEERRGKRPTGRDRKRNGKKCRARPGRSIGKKHRRQTEGERDKTKELYKGGEYGGRRQMGMDRGENHRGSDEGKRHRGGNRKPKTNEEADGEVI